MMKRIPCFGSLALPALLCCLPLAGIAAERAPWPAGSAHELSARPTQVVSGRITDDKGEGLPGVTVLVKGTTTGTSTGADGAFSLDVPDGATLVISSVGFVTQEVAVAGRTTINVTLATDNQQLSDVVVVGYTTQDRQNLSSAVTLVDVASAKRAPVATITEAIQGRTPGVQILNSGNPGQSPIINIRGVGSLVGSQPLYVIDGLWTDNIRDLNPQDVASLTILKDASSTSIYGSRGANGVVIITTKRGEPGKPVIGFNTYAGVQYEVDRWDLTDANKWADITRQAYENARRPVPTPALRPGDFANTDWSEEILRRGVVQDYNVTLSGGNRGDNYSSNFLISGDYFNQKGILIGTGFERYTLRLNSGLSRGKLKVNESLQLAHSFRTLTNGAPFQDIIRLPPGIPVRDSTEMTSGFGYGDKNNFNTFGTNPVASQRIQKRTQYNNRISGSVNAEYAFFDFLSYRLNLNGETLDYVDRDARKQGIISQNAPNDPAYYSENRGDTYFLQAEHILNFNKRLGDHNVNVLAGFSQQIGRGTNAFARNNTYSATPQYYFVLGAGSTNPVVGGVESKFTKRSYFSQLTYDYQGRYLATASYRRDGSSRFPVENRYGNFGAGSLGWRVSEESFFKDAVPAISNLKLRASYGVNGNDNTGDFGGFPNRYQNNYPYLSVINQNANYVLNGNSVVPGATQVYIPSLNIKWESRYTTNYGLDLGLLDNRLTLSAEYYTSRTKDALINPPILVYLGSFEASPFTNTGEFLNKGFEFQTGYQDNRKAFTYGISGNLTTLSNEVVSLTQDNQPIASGPTLTTTGNPLGTFYLPKFIGVFQTQEEVDSYVNADGKKIQDYAAPGDAKYEDFNGDGQINQSDRQFLGSPFPKLQFGLSGNMAYKGFDLSVLFQGQTGNKVYNIARATMDRTDDISNYRADFEPWTPTNQSNTTPRALKSGADIPTDRALEGRLNTASAQNSQGSSRFLEKGDFVRLKNVQLGYALPLSLTQRFKGVGSVRVYVTGQNVLTFTNYSGPDPEFTNGNVFERGVDFSSYPNLRSFTAGLQASF